MRTIDETKRIRKAAAGDPDAFEALVQQYQAQVYRLCYRMTGNAEDAADLTQESFLKAWRSLNSFQFNASFSTWLYRLASNACLDFLRAAKRRAVLPLTLGDDDGEELTLDLPDNQPTPEEAAIRSEEQVRLAEAMAQLEPEHRHILTLRVVNELSYAEIAEILGIREGTVKSRLSRARDSLRKKFYADGN